MVVILTEIDPLGQPKLKAGRNNCYRTCCPSVPTFQNKTNFKRKQMFATGKTVGLAEWIIDDTNLFLLFSEKNEGFQPKMASELTIILPENASVLNPNLALENNKKTQNRTDQFFSTPTEILHTVNLKSGDSEFKIELQRPRQRPKKLRSPNHQSPRLLAKNNLQKRIHAKNNYDPWRDIYLQGQFQSDSNIFQTHDGNGEDYVSDREYYDDQDHEYEYQDEDEIKKKQSAAGLTEEEVKWLYKTKKDRRRMDNNQYGHQDSNNWQQNDPGTEFYERYESSNSDQIADEKNDNSLTSRISSLATSPTFVMIFVVVGVPLAIGLAYWLLVVNGPTPVVRARSLFGPREEDDGDFNNSAMKTAKLLVSSLIKLARIATEKGL